MIHSLTVTFGAKYLTGMITSVKLDKGTFALVPTDKICGRSSSPNIPVDMNCILMKLYVTYCGLSKHSDR
jgi:hypothetical protein